MILVLSRPPNRAARPPLRIAALDMAMMLPRRGAWQSVAGSAWRNHAVASDA